MRKVEHIEQQIQELSADEFAELRNWLLEKDWQAWDVQIDADAKAGKLDKLVAESKADLLLGDRANFEAFHLRTILVLYDALPANVRRAADQNYALLKAIRDTHRYTSKGLGDCRQCV